MPQMLRLRCPHPAFDQSRREDGHMRVLAQQLSSHPTATARLTTYGAHL